MPAKLLLRFNLSMDTGALACVGLMQKLRSSGLLNVRWLYWNMSV